MFSEQQLADQLRDIVLAFRLNDLRTLLDFAGRNTNGTKTELLNRALSLGNLHS